MPVAQATVKLLSNPNFATTGTPLFPTSLPNPPTSTSSTLTRDPCSNPFAVLLGTPNPAKAYPYLPDKFYYASPNTDAINPSARLVDGQTSAGWFKMFEFFEVPSQSMGAYGPVAQGTNFDWFRQDLRPGLINLNLIIDEEVFLSVFGKQNSSYTQQLLNLQAISPSRIPVVIGRDSSSNPVTYQALSSGYTYSDATFSNANPNQLKYAFLQFLKVRHGGSGSLFGFGTGVGAERPFRSLSYPDINQTIMRPASLPPATPGTATSQTTYLDGGTFAGNPGFKNPMLYPGQVTQTGPVNTVRILPPAIPARRLIQPPDLATPDPGGLSPSNAGITGDGYINLQQSYGSLDATRPPNLVADTARLGAADATGLLDRTRHPYFRTEMLQKAMNLTTVRTHQYAVWITVGFFEVTQQGNPSLVSSAPGLAFDQLGREIGLNGRLVRYRGFYLVDRTRATGFNPANPGDFHDCVVYGHLIQ
jgi:hypothetical protein